VSRPRLRPALTLLHRWLGLALAGFLLLAGLTGAVLVWYEELDAALAPELLQAHAPVPGAPMLDPLALREAAQAASAQGHAAAVPLEVEPGRAALIRLVALPGNGEADTALANDQVFVDPYTGRVLGQRRWGDIAQGLPNLMPFIYRLHYTLALGDFGGHLFGIVALLWTLDCFVGAWLTLPLRRKEVLHTGRWTRWRAWWHRWRPAWSLRWRSGGRKLNFDIHRAGGLWTWAMLLVLAWSGVAFNLTEVYEPVMNTVLTQQPDGAGVRRPARVDLAPPIGWHAARDTGRRLMAEQAQLHGFTVRREMLLIHDPRQGPNGVYRYLVQSSRDIRDRWGSSQVVFDAATGELLRLWLPTGAASGDTFRTWITSLHMAALWGWPFRVYVTAVGLLVAALSLTGVVIWWRKRQARLRVAAA
jgi:uncharacterized iron-regulated membrane protein